MRRNPLYSRLCAVAGDEPLAVEILSAAPLAQRRPVMLLAAIHDVVLRGSDAPLAAWYPSRHGAHAIDALPDGRALANALRQFCAEHRDELLDLVTTRSVQTNEVGRSAVLAPAIASSDSHQPRALIELGSSGGLNLFMDRYRIAYRGVEGRERCIGPNESSLTLTCDISRGAHNPPFTMAPMGSRFGFDRNPLHIDHVDDARWLEACVWADDLERFEQLRIAIDLVASLHPDVRAADLADASFADLLESAVDATPQDQLPTIVHSWVMAYLDPDAQSRLADVIASIAATRDLDWIVFEPPSQVRGLRIDELGAGDADMLARVSYRSGRRSVAVLATVHSHGRWMAWQHVV